MALIIQFFIWGLLHDHDSLSDELFTEILTTYPYHYQAMLERLGNELNFLNEVKQEE